MEMMIQLVDAVTGLVLVAVLGLLVWGLLFR